MKQCPGMRSKNGLTGCMCPKRPVTPLDYLFIIDWLKEGTTGIKQIAEITLRDEGHLKDRLLRWSKVPIENVEVLDRSSGGPSYRHYRI